MAQFLDLRLERLNLEVSLWWPRCVAAFLSTVGDLFSSCPWPWPCPWPCPWPLWWLWLWVLGVITATAMLFGLTPLWHCGGNILTLPCRVCNSDKLAKLGVELLLLLLLLLACDMSSTWPTVSWWWCSCVLCVMMGSTTRRWLMSRLLPPPPPAPPRRNCCTCSRSLLSESASKSVSVAAAAGELLWLWLRWFVILDGRQARLAITKSTTSASSSSSSSGSSSASSPGCELRRWNKVWLGKLQLQAVKGSKVHANTRTHKSKQQRIYMLLQCCQLRRIFFLNFFLSNW